VAGCCFQIKLCYITLRHIALRAEGTMTSEYLP